MSEDKNKHLDFNLDFLEEKKETESSTGGKVKKSNKSEKIQDIKYGAKNLFGNLGKIIAVVVVVGFFIWIFSSEDSSSSSNSTETNTNSTNSSSSYFDSCDEDKLESLKPTDAETQRMKYLESQINFSTVNEYSSDYLIDNYNDMVDEYNSKRTGYNAKVDAYNDYLNSNCK